MSRSIRRYCFLDPDEGCEQQELTRTGIVPLPVPAFVLQDYLFIVKLLHGPNLEAPAFLSPVQVIRSIVDVELSLLIETLPS